MAGKQSQGHKKVTLKIPAELYENLGKLIEGTGFNSVTEFAVWVLRDVATGGKLEPAQPGLSQREIEIIRKRLQSLGYIE
jgi:hypothetical protein